MAIIGKTFRTAREHHGWSLSEAAARTRIKVQHLEAMERDDFSGMAAAAYAKGFIRIYAETLGVDTAPLVEAFQRDHAAPVERPANLLPMSERARDAVRWREAVLKALQDAGRVAQGWARALGRMDRQQVRLVALIAGLVIVLGVGLRIGRRIRARRADRVAAGKPVVEQTLPGDLLWRLPEPYVDRDMDLEGGGAR